MTKKAGADRASPRRRSCRVRSDIGAGAGAAGGAVDGLATVFSCSLTAIGPPCGRFPGHAHKSRSPCRTSVMKVAVLSGVCGAWTLVDGCQLICTDVDTSL